MIKFFLIGLMFLFNSALTEAQIDTIIVRLDSTAYASHSFSYHNGIGHPYRKTAAGKSGGGYIDSIRVFEQAIFFTNSDYYLIVYVLDSIKSLEGQFFGQYSNGILKLYDRWGRINFDGNNEYRNPDKNNSFPHSFAIGTNKTYTYKNYKSTSPKSIREVVYEADSRKYISRLYDKNGQIVNEKKGKR